MFTTSILRYVYMRIACLFIYDQADQLKGGLATVVYSSRGVSCNFQTQVHSVTEDNKRLPRFKYITTLDIKYIKLQFLVYFYL